jgi:hypothetical protein
MKKLTQYISIAAAGLMLFLQATHVSAVVIELEFDYNNTVTVGDTFTVDILADIPANLDLTALGFDLSTLNGNVSLAGASLASWITEDLLPINDVGGYVDLFDIPMSGDNTLLATLTFSADSIGNDTVSLLGDDFNFGGLFFIDGSQATNFDIDTSFDINVIGPVKDVPAPTALSLLLIGLAGAAARRKTG